MMHGPIRIRFTHLLAMFLYKAWWRIYWAKRCSSFVPTYCYTINTVEFHGGFHWLTVGTDAAADIWPLLVFANQSSCPSVRFLCVSTMDTYIQHGVPSYCDTFHSIHRSAVLWVTIPFLRGTQCLHHLSSWIWGWQIPLKFWYPAITNLEGLLTL